MQHRLQKNVFISPLHRQFSFISEPTFHRWNTYFNTRTGGATKFYRDMTQKQMPRAFLIVTKTTKANDNKLFKLAVINRSLSHHLWHKHTGSLYVLMYSGMPISNPWVAIILLNCQDLNVVPNFSCLEKSTMTYFLLIFFFYLFFLFPGLKLWV